MMDLQRRLTDSVRPCVHYFADSLETVDVTLNLAFYTIAIQANI